MKKLMILWFLVLIAVYSCAIPPRSNIDPEKQVALVYKNVPTGNHIRIMNFDALVAFNIYTKTKGETEFKYIKSLKRTALPMRYNFSQWGVEWTDPNNKTTEIEYKIMALDTEGNEFIELKQIVSIPENDGWKVVEFPKDWLVKLYY